MGMIRRLYLRLELNLTLLGTRTIHKQATSTPISLPFAIAIAPAPNKHNETSIRFQH